MSADKAWRGVPMRREFVNNTAITGNLSLPNPSKADNLSKLCRVGDGVCKKSPLLSGSLGFLVDKSLILEIR